MTTLTLPSAFEPIRLHTLKDYLAPFTEAPRSISLVSDRLPKEGLIYLSQSVRYKMNQDEHAIFSDALEDCTVLRKVLVRK